MNWPCFSCWNREKLSSNFHVSFHIFHWNCCPVLVSCLKHGCPPGMCMHKSAFTEAHCQPSPALVTWWSLCVWVHSQDQETKKEIVCLKKEGRTKAELQSTGDSAGPIVTVPTWKPVLRILCVRVQPFPVSWWVVGNVWAETENSESLKLLSWLPEGEGKLLTSGKAFLQDFCYFQLFQVLVHKPSSVLHWKDLMYTSLPR